MVYKRYIRRDGKVFGPYYYESYRDKNGNPRSRMISPPKKNHSKMFYFLLGIFFVLILGFFVLNSVFSDDSESSVAKISLFTFSEEIFENQTVNESVTEIVGGNISVDVVNISVKKSNIVLGKPVKWKNEIKIKINGTENSTVDILEIELPSLAGNVSVKKINNDTGEREEVKAVIKNEKIIEEVELHLERKELIDQVLNFFLPITGRVVDKDESVLVEIDEPIQDEDVIEIEYYTEAPQAFEEDTNNGKKVIISGPDELEYTDVLSFTEIPEVFEDEEKSKIKVYWEEGESIVDFDAYDLDANGLLDYVEWVVPHLSNQTYEIILITQAEHLDSDREFISDIYDETSELDGVWSETINSGDYVRVTFEDLLDNSNDITIYPRIVSGNPRIEIYEFDEDELIAEFTSLNNNEYNKVYLTSLAGEQDTFDLRVLGGSVEFDHIIDPSAPLHFTGFEIGSGGWFDPGKDSRRVEECDSDEVCVYHSDVDFYLPLKPSTSGVYPAAGTSSDSVTVTSGSPTSEGFLNVSLGFSGIPAGFNSAVLRIRFVDLDLYSQFTSNVRLNELFTLMDSSNNVLASLDGTHSDSGNFIWTHALDDGLFSGSSLTLKTKFDSLVTLVSGSSDTVSNTIEGIEDISICGEVSGGGGITGAHSDDDDDCDFPDSKCNDLGNCEDKGKYIWRLRDDSSSSYIKQNFNFTGFDYVNVSFWSWEDSFESGEFVQVMCDGNEVWRLTKGDYLDDQWNFFSARIDPSDCVFDNSVEIRFTSQNGLSSDYDNWYLDGINVTGVISAVNVDPVVTFVSPISSVNPTELNYTEVNFNVHVEDLDGVADLNDLSVKVNFTRPGEDLREDILCDHVNDLDTISANYSCIIQMWYFDGDGQWNITAYGEDLSGTSAINDSTNFIYNQLKAMIISPGVLTWNFLGSGSADEKSNNDPTIVNNTGNYDGDIKVSAINLLGHVVSDISIPASNFTSDISDITVCSGGTVLVNATSISITGSDANRGNLSLGGGVGQEELFYCIPSVPLVSSQTYSTDAGGPWAIIY